MVDGIRGSSQLSDSVKGFIPHPNILLGGLRITRGRLESKNRIAVNAAALKVLIEQLIAMMPFDEEAYLDLNPDVKESFEEGNILNLHEHFVTAGYYEGRFASRSHVDEEFYLKCYPDVADAVRSGRVPSAETHYISSGASEGRAPAREFEPILTRWIGSAAEVDEVNQEGRVP